MTFTVVVAVVVISKNNSTTVNDYEKSNGISQVNDTVEYNGFVINKKSGYTYKVDEALKSVFIYNDTTQFQLSFLPYSFNTLELQKEDLKTTLLYNGYSVSNMKTNEYFVRFSVYFQRVIPSEKVEIVSTLYFNTANKKFSNSHLSREVKKRGTGASQRGISKEQVCVPCGVNLDGKSIALISNLGKPRFIDIRAVFAGHIVKGSVLVTDSLRAYQRLSLDMDLYHIHIEHNRHRNGIFNIQTINSYHSRLKDLVLRVFKGVATKYLNNYLVYHNLVNISKESRREKVLIFLKFIHETLYYIRTIDISRRPDISIINY